MRPATPREAAAAAADVIVYEPIEAPSAVEDGRRGNPLTASEASMAYPSVEAPARRSRKPKKWSFDATEIYGGYTGLLVRSALIRSPEYDAKSLPQISEASDVYRILQHLVFSDQEHFVVLPMNNRNHVTAIYEAAIGAANNVTVNLRDMMKIAILTGTNNLIVAHNHPSGDPSPSRDDDEMTKRTKAALKCIGMNLLDHVIVAREGHYSYFSSGRLAYLTAE
jgi:DNA repair protein RadC